MKTKDVTAANGIPFRVVLTDASIVEFYDRSYDFSVNGQFTGGRYHLSTITDRASNPLFLDGSSSRWVLDADTMDDVKSWLASV